MQRTFLAALLLALAAGTAAAQEAPTGLMVNAHSVAAFGTTVRPSSGVGEPFVTGLGGGGGVQVGYGLTPRLMAYVGLDVAKQGSRMIGLDGHIGLSHLEIGARLSFPIRDPRIRPYAMASVARRGLGTTIVEQLTGESVTLRFSGTSVGAGGGVQYFVSPGLALDGAVSVHVGKFGNLRIDGDRLAVEPASTTTTRLMAGMSWYPRR